MNEPSPYSNSSAQGRHIGQIFFQRVDQLGDRTFIKLQTGGRFEEVSWRDFGAMVRNLILALWGLGLAPGETVGIIGENSLPWLCADLATLAGGWPNVVISPSLSDLMLAKILGHAECRAAFVQDVTGVGRLLNLKGQLPALSHIFVMEDSESILDDTWSIKQLIERGGSADAGRLQEILESVHPNDLATIMYTSGSTGEPKGVMRTHDNLLSNITNGGELVLSKPDELTLIVLSLNHLFGRFGFLKSVVTGRTTALIEATELKLDLKVVASLAGTAISVVPRVMERIWNAILDEGANRQLWQQLEELDRKRSSTELSETEKRQCDELRSSLKAAVRQSLGGRIKYIAYAAAAMPPRIMRFFELIGISLIGSYGSTECGGVTLCGIGENRPGNLGKPFPNVEIRIAGDGEILVRGPTVSPGYFKNPDATREVLDSDGWFYTGDLGALDSDGSLRIVGRKKDIFNCSDGSNIYPGLIELLLENESFIRQAVLLGDRRPFVAALVVPDCNQIALALNRDPSTLSNSEIEAALWAQIARVNGRLECYEQIRKIAVMKNDFPLEVRSINVFQKIKVDRKVAAERYQLEIDEIYSLSTEGDTE
ncbi:MAG TPA: AMP-binding protein [Candidatus Binatia bacterium]|jgi:long-chain acyl-CoA synthetase